MIVQSGSCTDTSDEVKIKRNPLPVAKITPLGDLDICNTGSVILQANGGAGLSYQWYKNGSEISSATAQTYTAVITAKFKVKVIIDSTGCSKTSKPLPVTSSCRQELESDEAIPAIVLYPNPASSKIYISGVDEMLLVRMYDISERNVPIKKVSTAFDISLLKFRSVFSRNKKYEV